MAGVDTAQLAAESLMDWWTLAGVSHAVAETPVNWLAAADLRRDAPPSVIARDPYPVAVASPRAVLPDTLDGFHALLAHDNDIIEAPWPRLDVHARRILPTGKAAPGLMVIADFPDADDMAAGTLLSGVTGVLFDAMLGAIGHNRDSVYLATLAVARPAGGLLTDTDTAALADRMRHHIALVGPQRVMLMGDKTSRALLSADEGMNSYGLRALNLVEGTIGAIGIAHPRFLLKQPSAKAQCWRTMQILLEAKAP